MKVTLDTSSIESYRTFLNIKRLPTYSVTGHEAEFPDEYASMVGIEAEEPEVLDYEPPEWMFDYQKHIVSVAIQKRKYAAFCDCGLGKTPILLEFAMEARRNEPDKNVLIISPLMVVAQTVRECKRFFGFEPDVIKSSDLNEWLSNENGGRIGIVNYDALNEDTIQGNLGALILDESSMLKSAYGKWGQVILRIGKGVGWKLCCSGTPAPNDRIEYANHAVFLDHFQNVNAFLATYFVNKGQTQERWQLKPHALKPFYKALSHWAFFLTNPATYGFKDNAGTLPPINVHIHDVDLTKEQTAIVGTETNELFATNMGGITSRSIMGQLAKGSYRGKDVASLKPAFIRELCESWPTESTLIWCIFNREQELLEKEMPDAESITGSTPIDLRLKIIQWFNGAICTCELKDFKESMKCQTKKKNTCVNTTEPIKTSGSHEQKKDKTDTTQLEEKSTQKMNQCVKKPETHLNHGKEGILKNDLLSDSNHMESQSSNIMKFSKNKKGDVPSVNVKELETNEQLECTSTIATKQGKSEGCCASTAIKESENSKTAQTSSKKRQCTCVQTGRILISKPKLLGFGLNLQVATRQIFSGLQDSYESYYQAVKRSNRVGSTQPLNVHIPITDIEAPMVENVLRKASMVAKDTEAQEELFCSTLGV